MRIAIALLLTLSLAGACKKNAATEPPAKPSPTTAPVAKPPPSPPKSARPAWYPAGFPLPEGWSTIGRPVTTPHATAGQLAWSRPLAAVSADYDKLTAASGWKVKTNRKRPRGGRRVRWERDGRVVQVSMFEVAGKARAIVVPPLNIGRFGTPSKGK